MKKFSDLDSLFREAENVDRNLFAEMRSNILLVAGDHYTKQGYRNQYPSMRFADTVSSDTRIRLTQNHLGLIMERLSNTIESATPGIAVAPHNLSEIHDQKKAQLWTSVKKDAETRYNLEQFFAERCDDFTRIGECHAYIYYDDARGPHIGYEPMLTDDGQELTDEMGNPQPDKSKPVMEGDFVWEKIFGFNLMRDRDCETFKESPYLIMRKMGQKKELKKKYATDPDKLRYVEAGAEKTFKVFEVTSGSYRDSNDEEVMLRYHFYRPCYEYPKGYFYITTSVGILEEGELPLGLFPIVSEVFDQIDTTPRGRSRIKRIRPYQGEVNRSASKIAEHQITLGDDKLVIIGNSKVSTGADIPGIRTISVFGQAPTVIPGRSGAQYLDYQLSKIKEMYEIADVAEMEQPAGQFDAYAMLFASGKQRRKHGRYIAKFTNFKRECYDLFFRLAKEFMPDSRKIKVVGTGEIMNIDEFKSTEDISFEITLEPGNEDLETRLGRQLVLSQSLQYVGSQMSPDQIGQMMRAMPYANNEEAFSDLTMKFDKARNIMLQCERGRPIPPGRFDDHAYIVQKLEKRMTEMDFDYLSQQAKDAYQQTVDAHMQVEAEKFRQIQMDNAQMIPMTGARVKVDLYLNQDPRDLNKVTRASAPYDAIKWLFERMDRQGVATNDIQGLSTGAQADILHSGLQNPALPQAGGLPQGSPMQSPQQQGAAPGL